LSQPAVLAVHTAVPGRARFSVPGLKRNDRVKRALEAGIAGRGIRSVSASTSTGTVLVLFETGHDLVEITRRLGESAERALDPEAPDDISARPAWHAMDADNVIGAVNGHPSGLSDAEAKTRLAETGANAIAPISGRTQFEILLSQFHSLPIALLAGGAVLSIATGGILDAAIILGVIGLNGAIGFIAEARAEETIGSLSESRAPVSRVLRGGKECEVPAEELVPGDLIELRRDEFVPADARVITANRLTVNEAMLTGESVPVAKATNVVAAHSASIGDRHNMVFRGTVVTGGAGRAVVTATGPETELGRIQSLLGSEDQPATPLQRQLDALGRQLVFGSVAACGLFAAIGLIRGFGLLPLLKTVTSLAVAAVPEGLPTLATTTLALAIQDLRRRRIIIRRLSAVEGLAGVEIACFDKTGTLTLNDMSVVRLYWNQTRARLTDEQFRTETGAVADRTTDRELVRLLELAILCNDVELLDAAAGHANGSATEMALVRAAIRAGLDVGAIRIRHPRRATLERAEDRRFMVTVHDAAADQKLVIVKGDPSEVLALCRWQLHNGIVAPLTAEDRSIIEAENLTMAEDALRVLGIAYRSAGAGDRGTRIEHQEFIWAGLVGMADPIRKGAPDLIDAFRRAGITSTMLTGDQRATAAAVARELGLSNGKSADIVEAGQLDEFEAPTAHGIADGIAGGDLPRVFARVAPGQKLQLVRKLQQSGMVVAMIGDGVNDTPPLRAADIGIVLGRSGVEAARGIADVVLLEDDLTSLIDAVERGRSVAINIRKAIRYLVATNLSEIIFMLVAAAAGRAHPLSPIQLLWINLLTDVLPALGLAMEPAAPDLMTRPPRDSKEPVISAAEFGTLARDASLIAASAFAAQACAARLGGSTQSGQTVGFTSLVSAQLFYAFACRSTRGSILSGRAHPPNPVFFGALGCAFAAQGAALFVPGFRNLFGPALGIADFGISLAAGAAPVLAIEVLRKAQSYST
jgi:Ca2+-transporting ATPase